MSITLVSFFPSTFTVMYCIYLFHIATVQYCLLPLLYNYEYNLSICLLYLYIYLDYISICLSLDRIALVSSVPSGNLSDEYGPTPLTKIASI